MMASAGNRKVLMLAFGHPENVLSLCKAVSRELYIELVFLVAKDRFRQGIMDCDISTMPYGLNCYEVSNKYLSEEVKRFVDSSFGIRFIRTPSKSILRNRGLTNFRVMAKAARNLNKEGYDVVHFNGSSWLTAYFRLFLNGKKRNIWTIHDYKPHSGEGNATAQLLRRLGMLRSFEYIQHYSWLKDRFIERFNIASRKVHHVYSGPFDIFKHFKPRPMPVPDEYILFFGRISPYKGIDLLVNAFLRLKEKQPELPVKLCIAGDGKLWFDEHLMARSDIFFLNRYINTGELNYLIQNCRFVVLPYTDSTHSAVVMTSYVFYKPVIASDVGGLHEVIIDGETGYLVPPNDIDAMVSAMQQLIVDKQCLHRFEKAIRKFVTKGPVSWDGIAKKMKSIYLH